MGAFHLIVHNPFGSYGKGTHISDAAEIQSVLDGPHSCNVLRIPAIEAPAPVEPTGAAAEHGQRNFGMTIFTLGTTNTAALTVPGAYVAIVPPQITYINGVPTGVLGLVGSAAWGPVGAPTTVGTYGEYVSNFGTLQPRRYDLGTAVAVAVQQGCNNIVCVRVTDGTDVAATYGLAYVSPNYGALLTSRYTGSYGNSIGILVGPGSAANSSKVTLTSPGNTPEIFDNIGSAGTTFWANMVAAINQGNNVRGPSQLVVATLGLNTSAPVPSILPTASQTLAGGADGAGGVNKALLLGTDGNARTGMYALRGAGCSVGLLVDCADSTSWPTQVTFALSEGIYMIDSGPSGDTIANAVSTKSSTGIDTYAMKILFGDWVYWLDTTNGGQTRLISPASFSAGIVANLSPEQSSLNKQVQAIVGTQKSHTNTVYSQADLAQLAAGGIDVIANPAPGGPYFAPVIGRNASSNAVIHGDNYTRLTNFIATTINTWMGQVVGLLQNPTTRRQAFTLLDQFLLQPVAAGRHRQCRWDTAVWHRARRQQQPGVTRGIGLHAGECPGAVSECRRIHACRDRGRSECADHAPGRRAGADGVREASNADQQSERWPRRRARCRGPAERGDPRLGDAHRLQFPPAHPSAAVDCARWHQQLCGGAAGVGHDFHDRSVELGRRRLLCDGGGRLFYRF